MDGSSLALITGFAPETQHRIKKRSFDNEENDDSNSHHGPEKSVDLNRSSRRLGRQQPAEVDLCRHQITEGNQDQAQDDDGKNGALFHV